MRDIYVVSRKAGAPKNLKQGCLVCVVLRSHRSQPSTFDELDIDISML